MNSESALRTWRRKARSSPRHRAGVANQTSRARPALPKRMGDRVVNGEPPHANMVSSFQEANHGIAGMIKGLEERGGSSSALHRLQQFQNRRADASSGIHLQVAGAGPPGLVT